MPTLPLTARNFGTPALLGLAALLFSAPSYAKPKGPWAQAVTDRSAEVRLEPGGNGPITVTVSPDGHPEQAKVQTVARNGGVLQIPFEGLAAGAPYTMAANVDGVVTTGVFTTAPAPNTPGFSAFSFLVYGDNRTDAVAHRAIVSAMTREPGLFALHTGDYVDVGGQGAMWDLFFSIETPLISQKVLFGTVGNHELFESGGGEWLSYFGANATTGPRAPDGKPLLDATYRWGNTRFFILNGFTSWKSGPDREWLDAELTKADFESDLAFRVVVTHHSPYSSGPHGNNPYFADAKIPELLVRHKVDVVFAGHDHLYERGVTQDLRWIVTGGGGAPLYRANTPTSGSQKLESAQHYLVASVDGDRFIYQAKRVDGSVIERCGIVRSVPGWLCGDALLSSSAAVSVAPIARVPVVASAPVPSGTEQKPPPNVGNVGGGARCGCAATKSTSAPFAGVLACVALIVLRRRTAARASRRPQVETGRAALRSGVHGPRDVLESGAVRRPDCAGSSGTVSGFDFYGEGTERSGRGEARGVSRDA